MASNNSGDIYAFTNSVSETSERNILSVMESIRATLQEMLSEVANLEPHWVAVEADGYYEAARKMNENAKQSADILESKLHSSLCEKVLASCEIRSGKCFPTQYESCESVRS